MRLSLTTDSRRIMTAMAALCVLGAGTAARAAIKADHPRLFNIDARVAELRQNACLDANGNPIPGCTPTPEYSSFYSSSINSGSGEAWTFALMYKLTGKQSYATTAIGKVKASMADGLGQKGGGERQDYFLYGHYYTRNAAVVYDWLYDLLSDSERASIMNYMNQIVYECTNPQTNPCKYSSGWSQNNPRDNYYYRHVLSAALLGLATYGENSGTVTFQDCTGEGAGPGGTHPLILTYKGTDYTDPLEFVYAKLDDQAVPWIVNREAGGGWREGTNYGRASKILMLEIFQALRDAGARNFFNEISFPRQAALFYFYELQPGNLYHYTNGDAPRDPLERANDSDVHLLRLLVDGLPGTAESEYAQYWLDSYADIPSDMIKKAFNFFLARRNHPTRDYRLDLAPAYYAPGMGYVNSRSSWATDAVSVNFTSTARVAEHTHKNQNEFSIFRSGWQAVSGNTYSRSGLMQQTAIHNTILVNHDGQRFGEGTGDVIRFEAKPEYTYAVGDASDAYYSNASGWGKGYDKMTDVYQRELVHLHPDVVVVYDRVTPTSAYAGTNVTFLLNSANKATISGRQAVVSNAGGKVFMQSLLPANAALSTVQDADGTSTWWRVEVDCPPTAHHQLLHVLYASSSSVTSMPAAVTFEEAGKQMVGVKVTMGSEDRVLMFSTDPNGAPPAGNLIFDTGAATPALHLLYDMVPLGGYDVEVSTVDGRRRIVVSEGSQFVASAQGVLEFRLPGAPSQVAIAEPARP